MQTSSCSVDFFTQARKALCLRSPFDAEDASSQTASTSALSTTFLPSGLANLLLKQADGGRKRHKRSHSAGEHKARPEKSRGSNIWTKTEEYFRELTVEDIDKLYEGRCLETAGTVCKFWSLENLGSREYTAVDSEDNDWAVKEEGIEERVKEDNDQGFMDVDTTGDGNEVLKAEEVVKGEEGTNLDNGGKCSKSVAISGFEWLLGTRHKIYLTSERPSKKRKLLCGDAGLEKLLVTRPVGGSSSLCHYCSTGETGDQLNRLIVCRSCKVAVHQRCYGVESDTDGTWSCSWCKQSKEGHSSVRPCLLCPKQGGALKPTQKSDNGALEFAHLFCCQWAPELYVENTRTMEPIMNTCGVNDSRRKLVCCLCKVKCGVCVRCSTGACRAAFHPLCAREARHRMEIWGRLGCDEVQMRAFCAKHSEVPSDTSGQCTRNLSLLIDSDSNDKALLTTGDDIHKCKISRRADDLVATSDERNVTIVDKEKINDQTLQVDGTVENTSNSCTQSEIIHGQEGIGTAETDANKDFKSHVSFNTILKKLIDGGEVDVKDLAEEFGVSPDLLSPLHTDKVFPNLNGKLETWLKDHGYLSSLHKPLKVKSLGAEVHVAAPVDIDTRIDTGTDDPQAVSIKSVLSNRRNRNNVRIIEGSCTSNEMKHDDENLMGFSNGDGCSIKNLKEAFECHDTELNHPKTEVKPYALSTTENTARSCDSMSERGDGALADEDKSKVSPVSGHLSLLKEGDSSCTHQQKSIGMDNGFEFEGSREREFSQLGASSSSGVCCDRQDQGPIAAILKLNGASFEQLAMTRNMDVLQFCPSDAVEGELIYYQNKLMSNAVKRKSFVDELIFKAAKNLQQEIDTARKHKWDAVLLSQYLIELREARKQGRKERRHKEAQEVLAAATAAAASSSRISSLRKDAIEESANVEENPKGKFSNGRPGFYSQQNPRVKETVSRSAASRLTLEKISDPFSLAPDFSVVHPRTCEICGRCETILSSILVCSSCKVAIHLDCYRGVKSSAGPWYCELCDELSSKGSGLSSANSWGKPYVVAECALCGGTAGAFRKSVDGHWIHAFCAEWLLESTFRRGQVNPISGMESLTKGNDLCTICSRKQGVCVKCSYGNCQGTFHASCARSAGFYMSVRSIGGKLQHKAYCGKHSIEQKAKAETQKHGIEEFRNLKQVRVELERLRLLCERIIKREKLKRELVICSHDILASNRDAAVLSSLSRRALYQHDLSSDSATTSTPGYTDGRSGSDTIQKSDDVTVDSTIARKKRIKLPVSVDSDQKTDDSSVSQHFMTPKPSERMVSSGKQVPHRPASRNLSEDAEKRSRFMKHPETFQKELVMTSDQASVKNQRLPKGFVYVPIRCLSKEKETLPDARSQEPVEDD